MIKKELKKNKGNTNTNKSLYYPVIYELEQEDLDITRDMLEFLAGNGDILTQPIFSDQEYKNLLKDLSLQIQNKEIKYFPHGSKKELSCCLSLFFNEQKFRTLSEIYIFFKKIIDHDPDLKDEFSHYLFYSNNH